MMTKSIQTCLLFIVLICMVSTFGYGRDYYVATNGNDNNGGTIDLPFLTINKAASVAQAGDVVIIKSGTYIQSSSIKPVNSGTSESPITYRAEVAGQTIIDGQSTVPIIASREGLFHVIGKSWLIIDGLRLINSGFFGFAFRDQATNILIKNCSTFNTGASGIVAANTSNITVLNNTVQKACQALGSGINTSECITMASVEKFEVAYNTVFDRLVDVNNGGEGIDAKNSCKDGSIHHNTLYDLVRHAIYIDAFLGEMNNIDVYANKVYNCPKSAIVIVSEEGGTVTGVKVHDNVVYNCGNIGIWVAGYLRNGPLKNVEIYQNTIFNCGGKGNYLNSGILIEASNPQCSGFVFRNNIVSGCPVTIKSNVSQPFAITIDNNIFSGPIGSFSATTTVTNTLNVDPLFVNTEANDVHLQKGSPAIDKATGTPLSMSDFDDTVRPTDGDEDGKAVGDLGAFEYSPTTGIFTIKDAKTIKIYPNPAQNSVIIEELKDHVEIELYDVLGKKVHSQKADGSEVWIDISKLSNGSYFIKVVHQDNLLQTGKFIKYQ
jgi:parallel beta-helix repeat protein